MTGTIQVSAGRGWSVSRVLFCWVVDTLAEQVPPDVAATVRASCAAHPGRLDLRDFPPEQRTALCRVLRALPALARERLPRTTSRAAVITTIDDIGRVAERGLATRSA
jgi:hypothetical protein